MRWIDRFEEYFLAAMLAGMTLVTFGQVVARYVFNYSFTWAMEFTSVLFAWLIFIGAAYGVRVSAHIGIDVLTRLLSARVAHVVAVVATALCVLYSCILAFGGWQYISKLYAVGVYMQDIPIPQWMPKIVLPIGFVLLAVRFGIIFWKLITGRDVHLLGDEVQDALKMREEMEDHA